ncbi:MAG: YicC family protein [Nitrospira sp.]|nr:YicC family protein [Nitrospira sp.]MCP9441078.1 YicC family protein [Nitrospira sp.]
MITSMTGFGRRQAAWLGGSVTVEVRSVNHRFLEVMIRVPKSMGVLEDRLKKAVQDHCARGRIELTVMVQGGRTGTRSLHLDAEMAKQYHDALRSLQRALKLRGSLDIRLVAGFRDIFVLSDQPADDPKLAKLTEKLGTQAIKDLVTMRKKEGAILARDLLGRLKTIDGLKKRIAERAPFTTQESFSRMKERVQRLLNGEMPDAQRLYQELAVYADRSDITEELVRLNAHMIQFQEAVGSTQPAGKTLDFLIQEMGREVNTIGSKAGDLTITGAVVQIKAELERLREQVQNVE